MLQCVLLFIPESYCPQKCKCKSGRVIDKKNGKDVISDGYCQHYCSKRGYCGIGEKFTTGTDCTGCGNTAAGVYFIHFF